MGEEPKNFHDVAHPNSTPQSSTSRPIIVDHEPILKDPMMKDASTTAPLARHGDEPKVASPVYNYKEELSPEPSPSEVPTEVNSSIPKNDEKTAKNAKPAQDEQDAKIEQLIENKTYVVPVGHLKRKQTLRLLIIAGGGVLVVGVFAAYIIASKS